MHRTARGAVAVLTAVLVAACSGGGSSSPSVTQSGPSVQLGSTLVPSTPTPAQTAPSSPTARPSSTSGIGPLPPNFDPCTLLTASEASQVNGVTYGAGVAHTLNGLIECVWQSDSAHASVTVQVLYAPGISEAQIAYTEAQAAFKGASVTKLPPPPQGTFDEAAIARVTILDHSTGGIYVRQESTFFDVVYVAGTAPSDGQLVVSALLVLGSIP